MSVTRPESIPQPSPKWWLFMVMNPMVESQKSHFNKSKLVGGFNLSEKYARQNGFIFPNFRGENSKKYLMKPPPRKWMVYNGKPRKPY